MPISDHLDHLQRVCAKAVQQHSWPLEKIFRSGLMSIREYSADYDTLIDDSNPFYQEFTQCSQQEAISEDDLFSLFECLVIFIRMRQMVAPDLRLSAKEQSVLEYFETCGEWTACDETVVSQWYWKHLPETSRHH